jgi:AraC-like DNA-binding protein
MAAAATVEPDRVIFATSLVSAGEWRCAPDQGGVVGAATERYRLAFPRRACWIASEDAPAFLADATVVPLLDQGRAYRCDPIDGDGEVADWFGVEEAVLRQGLASLDVHVADRAADLFPRRYVTGSAALYLAQRCVFNHLRASSAPDPLYVEETIISILAEVLELALAPAAAASPLPIHRQLVEGAREHLNRRLLEPEHLSAIAAALGVSTFHLCRIFRRETGTSLHRYRTELRLRRSLEWLDDSDDITAVALEAGFAQHSHFTAAFRRSFGISPSEFRTLWRSRRVPRR